MADYGVTNTGFVAPRLAEILTANRAKAVELFQDLVLPGDVVDTSDSSILGRLIGLVAPGESDLWETAQQVYDAFNPTAATGFALDNLVFLSGLTRNDPTYSSAQAVFTGDVGTLIPAGQNIRPTTSSNDFQNPVSVSISASSAVGVGVSPLSVSSNTTYTLTYSNTTTSSTISYTSGTGATLASIEAGIGQVILNSHPLLETSILNNVLYVSLKDKTSVYNWSSSSNLGINKASNIASIQARETGPIAQEANTITGIQTPVLGWDSVTNPLAASLGSNEETDSELRERFRQSKYLRATNILEALYSALISLDNIKEVRIYENDTDVTDDKGIPAHSFLPIVLGGLDSEIANTIWKRKPLGIRSVGNTSVIIYDSQGFAHSIGFQRPIPVTIYININLTTDSNYPENGDDSIKTALVSYFNNNFGIGDAVIYSRLYTPINSIPGHQVNSLKIGTSPNPDGTSNIVVPFNAIASLSTVNITITKS